MKTRTIATFVASIVAVLFAAGQNPCVAAEPTKGVSTQARKDTVLIALRPNVEMDSRVIRLGDVATISGGDAALRMKLTELDLEDALPFDESLSIFPQQIEFRLRIAGINLKKVVIRGDSTRVTANALKSIPNLELVNGGTIAPPPIKLPRKLELGSYSTEEGPLEQEIIQAAKQFIQRKLPWPEENIDIRLSLPLSTEIRQVASADGYDCSVEMRSAGPTVGRVSVRVIATAPQKPTYDVVVGLEVRHFDNVALATKSLERGHVLNESDVYFDRRDVTDMNDYCSNAKDLIGTTTKRAIRPLMPLRANDVESAARTEKDVVIKRRENVKMVAHFGGFLITASGEAQQDGRMGEVIRLKNLESNSNVQGRVTGPGEVEVAY